MGWDPEQYHKFQSSRFAPFNDLVSLLNVREGIRGADLGCGTGELTEQLSDLLPGSSITGMDTSEQMLAKALCRAKPGLTFHRQGVEQLSGEWDLLFSHAVLHWIDDHRQLMPRLFSHLAPGGQLLVQIPSNHAHPAHRAIVAIAGEEPYYSLLQGWYREPQVLEIDQYAELLFSAGAEQITVMEKVYPTVMPDGPAIAEWTKGSTLVPYLERLPADQHASFLERYALRLADLYPQQPVYYTFRRILISATRPSS